MQRTDRKMQSGRLVWGLVGLLWLAGCAAPTALEQDYGNSVRNNLAQSILNPRAGLETTPAVGLGPKAGVNEMDRYDRSFKGDEKKPLEMKVSTY